jgi:gliding motility-associated lipoprotein GldB
MLSSISGRRKICRPSSGPAVSPLALLAGMLLFFSACGKKHCLDAPDVSHIPMEVHIGRLEKSLHKIPSAGQLGELLQRQPMFAEAFLGLSAYRPDSAQMEAFVGMMNDPNIDSLFMEIDRVYGDLSGVEEEFSTAFRHITYHYPAFRPPAIRTVATGMVHDLYVSDSLLIIGLDWYLGEDSPYRPNLYAYLLKRYQPAYLVPQLMLHFAAQYTPPPADATTLSEMIYYGKIFYFARHMLPCAPDSLFTGYTAEETADIGVHEPVIWASVLENELLFETNHTIVRRLFEERPKVLEIGEKCPGRIGRWLGYRIVSAYMAEHPSVTIPELMAMQDARTIFNESKYRPVPY